MFWWPGRKRLLGRPCNYPYTAISIGAIHRDATGLDALSRTEITGSAWFAALVARPVLPRVSHHREDVRTLPAGLGDIATGIAAPFVARRLARGTGRRAALWLNAFGMVDLVVALTLGGLTGFGLLHVTPSGTAIGQLPLALIPTAGVPLLLVLHIQAVSALVKVPRTPRPATVPLTATAQ